MKNLLAIFLFTIISFSINAQKQETKQTKNDNRKIAESKGTTVAIVNDEIIGDLYTLMEITKKNILTTTEVSKDEKLSSKRLFSFELIQKEIFSPELKIGRIIKVKMKHKFNIKSQKDLNTFFGLEETKSVYVNGYLLNKKYSIINECIKEIQIVTEIRSVLVEHSSGSKVLNIII